VYETKFTVQDIKVSKVQVEVFWVVTPCSVVVGYQRFGEVFCLHLQGELPVIHENPNLLHRENLRSQAVHVLI
jgi:hypothetical protein